MSKKLNKENSPRLAKIGVFDYTEVEVENRRPAGREEYAPMSDSSKFVPLGEIIKEFDLEILCQGPDYEKVPLRTVDVNRPGLPLGGFFEHFDTKRLLLIGLTEHTFLENMTPEER